MPPALVRVLIALVLGVTPAFEERFGSAAIALLCVGLAAFAGVAAYVVRRSEAAPFWPVNALDLVTLALVVPVVVLASGVAVADPLLGGDTRNFAAAAAAVVGVVAALTLVSAAASSEHGEIAALALLPAPLIVAVTLVGAERFAGKAVTDAVSAAWMVAATATIIDGFVPRSARTWLPGASFAVIAIAAAAVGRTADGARLSGGNAAVAFGVTVVAGVLLLAVPALAQAIGRGDVRDRPAQESGPFRGF